MMDSTQSHKVTYLEFSPWLVEMSPQKTAAVSTSQSQMLPVKLDHTLHCHGVK